MNRPSVSQLSGYVERIRESAEFARDAVDQAKWLERYQNVDWEGERNIDEYRRLMSVDGRPSIDVTPAYCLLGDEKIKALREGLPKNSKVMFIVRDPFDRLMSQVKLHHHLHGNYRGDLSRDDLDLFLKRPDQRKRWDYASTIESWGRIFGRDFKVFDFELLARQPKQAIKAIAEFLEFELADDYHERDAESFSHADRNQNLQDWLPTIGKRSRGQIANALKGDVERLLRRHPEYPRGWLRKLENNIASAPAVRKTRSELGLDVQRLMRMTESLGDNCEYGFWQRDHDYEPSSLFRWAITPMDSLLAFLAGPKPLYDKHALEPHSPAMVNDRTFGFKFHSKLVRKGENGLVLAPDLDEFREIFEAEKTKIDFLQRKFFATARRKPAVYVVKANAGLREGDVLALSESLRSLNANHMLLWASAAPDREVGVAKHSPGVYEAFLSGFARYVQADAYVGDDWSRVMADLATQDDIRTLLRGMFR